MDVYDLIIVGAGPAGIAAGIYALERKLNILVIEAGKPGGQLTGLYPDKNIYDYPSYPHILAKELAAKLVEHALDAQLPLVSDSIVEKISPESPGFIIKSPINQYKTKSVLLATGMGQFLARKLQVPGEAEFAQKGIYYQKIPDKVVGKRVVVVGGGDTALETAVAAAEKGAAVSLVHRSSEFRALEKTVDQARTLAIPLYLNAKVVAFKGSDQLDTVEIVKDSGVTSLLSADIVAICIGVELTKSTLIADLNIKIDRQAIVVDENMQTNLPGIFACGDVVVPAGKYKRISVAVGIAATAINGVYTYLKNPSLV